MESQVLLGTETPVAETLQRLMQEGLDRHEAIHAIEMVLASHMHDLLQRPEPQGGDPNVAYSDALRRLTAAQWREQAE